MSWPRKATGAKAANDERRSRNTRQGKDFIEPRHSDERGEMFKARNFDFVKAARVLRIGKRGGGWFNDGRCSHYRNITLGQPRQAANVAAYLHVGNMSTIRPIPAAPLITVA